MNIRTVRQNRVLTAVLIILIASLVALIAVTAGVNRKAKPTPNPEPPAAGKPAESSPETDAPAGQPNKDPKTGSGKKDEPAAAEAPETQKLDEPVKPGSTGTEAEADKDTAAVPTSAKADTLPNFRLPLENAVAVKGCSLTVPVFSATMNDYRIHKGIDFACAPGTPVLAAAEGTVASVSKDPMMGWTVALNHAGGASTLYRGLSEETRGIVNAGDKVIAGQVIGSSGETALIESAEENHLHFELAVNGKTVDPAEYIDVVMLSDLYED